MKHIFKRTLATVLILCMVLSVLPVMASAKTIGPLNLDVCAHVGASFKSLEL